MSARRLAKLVMGVVLAATGSYVFVYLWRWEWNRALLAGTLFIAAEVAMVAVVVMERLRRLEQRIDQRPAGRSRGLVRPEPDPTLERIRQAAPAARQPFAWLRPHQDQFGVFVPILMGVGVVASALAWVVERLARATAGPALERGLAGRLQVLAWPDRPLDQPEHAGPLLLAEPRRQP